jgi:ribosomal protein L29
MLEADEVKQMDDTDVLKHIEDLVEEEHRLRAQSEAGHASADEHERIRQLEIALDQAWDLLRQRRARREMGENPERAFEREPGVVERYQQ